MKKPKWTITKEFEFCASHCLDHLPKSHPCHKPHGHNYTVIVEMSSNELNTDSMVLDYRAMEPIKKWLDSNFDHAHLNTTMLGTEPTTTECISRTIYNYLKQTFPLVSAIIVKETNKTSCRYEEIED